MSIENAEPVSAVEMAALLGLHERQVRKLAERNIIERDGRGRYVIGDAVRSYCAHLREQAAGRAAGDSDEEGAPDLATERALLARAQREGQNLKNGVLRGELLHVEDVEAAAGRLIIAARAKLLTLPTKAAPKMLGLSSVGESRDILTVLVHDALSELSDTAIIVSDAVSRARKRLGRLGAALESGEPLEASAAADGQ